MFFIKKAIFYEKNTLYKYTGEYYGNIIMAPKVDSLNIVSSTKPLKIMI